jgi:hypothetical protein
MSSLVPALAFAALLIAQFTAVVATARDFAGARRSRGASRGSPLRRISRRLS